MPCLYSRDYGPPDAAFDPAAGGSVLLRGFEAHASELRRAQNRGQLEAMKRQLQHGQQIQWCDPGYSWTNQTPVEHMFEIILVAVVLPWVFARFILPAFRTLRSRVLTHGPS